jgi:hypothetical protein
MKTQEDKDKNPQLVALQKLVERSTNKWKSAHRDIETSRNYALGIKRGKKAKEEYAKSDIVQSNQIYATLQAMLPLTYAQNPEIAVKPESYVDVSDPMLPYTRQFSRTLEVILNKVLADAGLKRTMLGLVRSIQTSRVGWIKASYQRDYQTDPLIANRLEDAQDQLAALGKNVESLMDEQGYSEDELTVKKVELEQMIKSLESQVSVLRSQGLVLDNILVEDMRMDSDIDSLEDYRRASWIAQRTWMDKDSIMTQFGMKKSQVDKLTSYTRSGSGKPTTDGESKVYSGDKEGEALVAVWEFWDKKTGTVYWYAEGGSDWLRDPWQPAKAGQRFYPFFCIGFNYIDGREWPLSDVEFLTRLQDEYDLSRTQEAKHRELTKPMFVADRARVSRQDVTSFSVGEIGEIILIDAGGQPVNQVFQPAAHPPMIPTVYDVTRVRGDMEWVSGLGDAQRGSVGRAKTATEASIQQEGLSSRVDARKDQLEDFISEIATYATEVILQEMPIELVQRYAGQSAYWPADQMTKDQVFSLTEIKIRAGTSGKPNKAMELEKWAGLMPEIKEVLERAIGMQQELMIPIRMNPWIKLLSETMRKADEAFDVMEMFPEELVQYFDQIGMQKMQLQQAELQMQQMQMGLQGQEMQMQEQQMQQQAVQSEMQQEMNAQQLQQGDLQMAQQMQEPQPNVQ